MNTTILRPFSKGFLSQFVWTPQTLRRDNDSIRVGSYIPAPYEDIENGVEELITYLYS